MVQTFFVSPNPNNQKKSLIQIYHLESSKPSTSWPKKEDKRTHKKLQKYHKPNSQFYPFLIQHHYTSPKPNSPLFKGEFSQLSNPRKRRQQLKSENHLKFFSHFCDVIKDDANSDFHVHFSCLYNIFLTTQSHASLWNKDRVSLLTEGCFHELIWRRNHMSKRKASKKRFCE